MESNENKIRLSIKDHCKAHELLFEIYGNLKDQAAKNMLRGNTIKAMTICRVLGALASHAVQEENKTGFWNSKTQKANADKSMAKPEALKTRSEGGKIGGRKAKLDIAIKANERYIFSYKGQDVIGVINCRTGNEVLEILNKLYPTNLTRATQLLNGSRRSLYGWTCRKLEDAPPYTEENLRKLK
jgi:hypothetical protein